MLPVWSFFNQRFFQAPGLGHGHRLHPAAGPPRGGRARRGGRVPTDEARPHPAVAGLEVSPSTQYFSSSGLR